MVGRLVVATLIVGLCAGALAALPSAAARARVHQQPVPLAAPGARVVLMHRSADVYALWKELGVQGRTVVHLGRFLQFVEVDEHDGYRTPRATPLRTEALLPSYEAKVSHENLLWVAAQANIARALYHVLPAATFAEKESAILEGTEPWLRDGDAYVLQRYGTLRYLAPRLPARAEPVLVNVDASYLAGRDVASVLAELRGAALSADLVTLSLSEDNPAVTDGERQALAELAKRWRP